MRLHENARSDEGTENHPDRVDPATAPPPADLVFELQEAITAIGEQTRALLSLSMQEATGGTSDALIAGQLALTNISKRLLRVQEQLFVRISGSNGEDPTLYCDAGSTLLSQGRPVEAARYFERAAQLRPNEARAHKGLGDASLALAEPGEATRHYRAALSVQPNFPEVDNNLAVAHLGTFEFMEAQRVLQRILQRDYGLPSEKGTRFDPAQDSDEGRAGPYAASPFKLIDRIDQLTYLIAHHKIHASFSGLVDRYRALLEDVRGTPQRAAYAPLTTDQLRSFGGYFDRVIHYADADALPGPALNPDRDYAAIEEEYLDTRMLFFDDFLTEAALTRLWQFFVESTVFFRHSEAGFVGSYVTDGFSCSLVFQILAELRARLPRLLGHRPLNNMWCYRYGPQGSGVRPHNGDGSVTINFYLTPDYANIGGPDGGGMVMYDKEHPQEWDWLTFNMYKDDPGIQAKIAEYLADARAVTIPYRCNRAVLFHSTLFHKTDPFSFRDDYGSRRMNITMLFGRRGQESAPLR